MIGFHVFDFNFLAAGLRFSPPASISCKSRPFTPSAGWVVVSQVLILPILTTSVCGGRVHALLCIINSQYNYHFCSPLRRAKNGFLTRPRQKRPCAAPRMEVPHAAAAPTTHALCPTPTHMGHLRSSHKQIRQLFLDMTVSCATRQFSLRAFLYQFRALPLQAGRFSGPTKSDLMNGLVERRTPVVEVAGSNPIMTK